MFYTTYNGPLAIRWAWETLSYATEDAMDAAAALLEMTDNIYSVNPFPTGFAGPLNTALVDQGVAIKGITNLAAHGATRKMIRSTWGGSRAGFIPPAAAACPSPTRCV